MKVLSSGKYNKGFSTLEILIAFAVLILCIGAVILVVFGNQSVSVDTETSNEAIYFAKNNLENARAISKQDFFSLVSTTTVSTSTIAYTKILEVLDVSQCKKQTTSTVTWMNSGRPQTVEFSTFFADALGAIALGSDCDSESPGGWDDPVTAQSIGIGGQGATDIDVRNNFIYLTSDASAPSKEDFFIYKFDPIAVSLTELSKLDISDGLNAIDTVNNYAFTLNDDVTNHLIIFNISNPSSPTSIASTSLPNMTSGIGRSIYYHNNFIYIGTQYLPCPVCTPERNNEFHVYDVSNPATPLWRGSSDVDHNINDIVVRGNLAYLATSADDKEIIILDISNPSNITQMGIFDAEDVPSGAGEDATSLYLLGNKLYFGRKRAPATRPDFYIIDITNPTSPFLIGSKNLGMNPGSGPADPRVTGIIVKSKLAFIGLDDPNFGLKIIDISQPSLPYHPVCTSLNFSENSTALDMDNDSVFTANASNDEIRVIRDQPSSCP